MTNTHTDNLMLGSGQPWRQQYQINTVQSDDITEWTASSKLPGPLDYSQAIVTKNRVYLLGGIIQYDTLSTVYTALINNDGTLGTWETSTPLPNAVCFSQAIVTKNRVYLLGGANGYNALSSVYTAPINSDGTLGTWTTGTPLPVAIYDSQAIVTKNRVYLLGGRTQYDSSSTVYTAPINNDGTLGAWEISTPLPIPIDNSSAIVTKNRVYLLGGYNDDDGYLSNVYTAPINNDGTLGAWTTGTPLPIAFSNSQAIVTRNKVYLLGGINDYDRLVDGQLSTIYTAYINTEGVLGEWKTSISLPIPLEGTQAIITKSKIYLLGGYNDNDGYLSNVYMAPFSGGTNDYSPYYDNCNCN